MAPIPPWSDLPPELLSTIANYLDSNPIDILSFRSVCNSWRSSLPLSPHFLSPLLPLTTPSLTHPSKFYLLYATAVYALRPPIGVQIEGSLSIPKTWLLFVDQSNPGKLSIRKPNLRETKFNFPRKLNMLDFRVSEIGRSYHLAFDNRRGYNYSHKAVFFSNGSAVVVLLDGGKLGLLRLGLENECKIVHDGFHFDDIVSYRDRVLAIDRPGRVYEILDFNNSTEIKPIVGCRIKNGGLRRKLLIESLGMLHSVFRFNVCGREKFKVYVLNEEMMKWVEVTNVGDRIFFFCSDFSFSTSSQEFEGSFGKNCIIFYEYSFIHLGESWLFQKSRFDAPRVGVYHLEDGARIHPIDSYPAYSNILWPPPNWLWPNSKLKLLRIFETASRRLLGRTSDGDLKAKYKELYNGLSHLVRVVVFEDDIRQVDVLNFLKQADMVKTFLNELIVDIDEASKRLFIVCLWIIFDILILLLSMASSLNATQHRSSKEDGRLSSAMIRRHEKLHTRLKMLLKKFKYIMNIKKDNVEVTSQGHSGCQRRPPLKKSKSRSGSGPSMGPLPQSRPNYNYAPVSAAQPHGRHSQPRPPQQHGPYAYGSAHMTHDGYTHPRYQQLDASYGQNMQPRPPQQYASSGSTSTQQPPHGSTPMTHDGYTHPRTQPTSAARYGQNPSAPQPGYSHPSTDAAANEEA